MELLNPLNTDELLFFEVELSRQQISNILLLNKYDTLYVTFVPEANCFEFVGTGKGFSVLDFIVVHFPLPACKNHRCSNSCVVVRLINPPFLTSMVGLRNRPIKFSMLVTTKRITVNIETGKLLVTSEINRFTCSDTPFEAEKNRLFGPSLILWLDRRPMKYLLKLERETLLLANTLIKTKFYNKTTIKVCFSFREDSGTFIIYQQLPSMVHSQKISFSLERGTKIIDAMRNSFFTDIEVGEIIYDVITNKFSAAISRLYFGRHTKFYYIFSFEDVKALFIVSSLNKDDIVFGKI